MFQKILQPFALYENDDWSFVIKTHAAIEAAMIDMLVGAIGDARLTGCFENLPLSDSKIRKVVVAENLGLLDKKQRRFIRIYSELRNDLVHKVKNLDFNFYSYVASLNKDKARNLKECVLDFASSEEQRAKWDAAYPVGLKGLISGLISMLLGHAVTQMYLARARSD